MKNQTFKDRIQQIKLKEETEAEKQAFREKKKEILNKYREMIKKGEL